MYRALLLLAASLLTTSCMSFAPVVEEPLRVGNVQDLTPEALGLRFGDTTLEQARAALGRYQVTGITEDTYAAEKGPIVQVLAGDYQSRVHVFQGGHYLESIVLPTHGLPPYGLAVRLGSDGPANVLLVLYRDPLARSTEPPTLLSYRSTYDHFELAGRASFEALVEKHGGMTNPMLLGNDLDAGVMLVARDHEGALWDTTYLLRIHSGKLDLEAKPISDALRCSCVRAYAMGGSKSH